MAVTLSWTGSTNCYDQCSESALLTKACKGALREVKKQGCTSQPLAQGHLVSGGSRSGPVGTPTPACSLALPLTTGA